VTDSLVSRRSENGEDGAHAIGDGHARPGYDDRPAQGEPADAGSPAPERNRSGGKDPLLDLIRIAAIGRVVLWHTWAWAWLTWIPAMPVMFFVTGALLEGSVTRHGWLSTLRSRLRRLLVPYWVFAAACWLVMVLDGWRPNNTDYVKWAVPLLDPLGSVDLPGLWIPLWYIRAYLWFLLAAGVLAFLWRRLGAWSVVLSVAAAVLVWFGYFADRMDEVGLSVLAIGDAVTYLPFVLAGMGYWATRNSRELPGRKALLAVSAGAAGAAVLVWQRWGPDDGIVNSSYLLTLLVGVAGVALVFGLRDRLVASTDRWSGLIHRLNSRALTIYLWHGFGLVAAQRLVGLRVDDGPLQAVLSLAVVLGVVLGAVVVFGPVEDVAAGRRSLAEVRGSLVKLPAPGLATVRRSLAATVGVGLIAAALVVGIPEGARIEGPLSGQAVLLRGQLIDQQLDGSGGAQVDVTGLTPQEVLDDWVEENRDMLDEIGNGWLDGAVAAPSGEVIEFSWYGTGGPDWDTVAWWSMTKTVTSAWLLRLVDAGVVGLDDPLADYVDHTPRAGDMTLRQLANHTSGIPPELDDDLMEANPVDEIQDFVDQGELAFEPGEGYGYSRVGYFLLALALERASGQPYQEAVREMAAEAGVEVSFDDWGADWSDEDVPVTDPDGHGYHGGLWSAGGLISSSAAGAGLLQWIFSEGLSPAAVATMAEFPDEDDRPYYGLGVVPLCPCEREGDLVTAERVGLDTASGTLAVDLETSAAVMLRPDDWWSGEGTAVHFYDLQHRLLDAVTQDVR
jgi:peptidoglycan/LPS O-acetylase OafA/YrhL